MSNNYKDIRVDDYVRIAYNKIWPGVSNANTADIIDWGFIVRSINTTNAEAKPHDIFRLVSHSSFTMVIEVTRSVLEKILVELHPKRTFAEVSTMRQQSDIIWKVKSDRDEVVLLVFNPHIEYDEDGEMVVWDKVIKEDGSELTDLEEDTYFDDLRNSIKDSLR